MSQLEQQEDLLEEKIFHAVEDLYLYEKELPDVDQAKRIVNAAKAFFDRYTLSQQDTIQSMEKIIEFINEKKTPLRLAKQLTKLDKADKPTKKSLYYQLFKGELFRDLIEHIAQLEKEVVSPYIHQKKWTILDEFLLENREELKEKTGEFCQNYWRRRLDSSSLDSNVCNKIQKKLSEEELKWLIKNTSLIGVRQLLPSLREKKQFHKDCIERFERSDEKVCRLTEDLRITNPDLVKRIVYSPCCFWTLHNQLIRYLPLHDDALKIHILNTQLKKLGEKGIKQFCSWDFDHFQQVYEIIHSEAKKKFAEKYHLNEACPLTPKALLELSYEGEELSDYSWAFADQEIRTIAYGFSETPPLEALKEWVRKQSDSDLSELFSLWKEKNKVKDSLVVECLAALLAYRSLKTLKPDLAKGLFKSRVFHCVFQYDAKHYSRKTFCQNLFKNLADDDAVSRIYSITKNNRLDHPLPFMLLAFFSLENSEEIKGAEEFFKNASKNGEEWYRSEKSLDRILNAFSSIQSNKISSLNFLKMMNQSYEEISENPPEISFGTPLEALSLIHDSIDYELLKKEGATVHGAFISMLKEIVHSIGLEGDTFKEFFSSISLMPIFKIDGSSRESFWEGVTSKQKELIHRFISTKKKQDIDFAKDYPEQFEKWEKQYLQPFSSFFIHDRDDFHELLFRDQEIAIHEHKTKDRGIAIEGFIRGIMRRIYVRDGESPCSENQAFADLYLLKDASKRAVLFYKKAKGTMNASSILDDYILQKAKDLGLSLYRKCSGLDCPYPHELRPYLSNADKSSEYSQFMVDAADSTLIYDSERN